MISYKIMRKICLALLFLILPLKSFAFDLPQPSGWVNDFANVISAEHKTKLTALINQLQEKTSAEIMVVTIASIAPYDEKEYARMIFDSWKPGKKGKDNGILILLAVQQRRWRIETGYGMEGMLPDGVCGQIGRDYMVPYFKTGNYDAGIYYGVERIVSIIARNLNTSINNIQTGSLRPRNSQIAKAFLPFFAIFFFSLWNIPWPIFVGLPFTLLFASAMAQTSKTAGICAIIGYFIAMIIRHKIWTQAPADKRKSFFWTLIWGLAALGGSNRGYSSGGFGGGSFGGGSGGGGGGGGGF